MMRPAIWTSYFIDFTPEEMVRLFSEKKWYELELSDEHAKVLLERGDPYETGRAFKGYAARYEVTFPQGHLLLSADIAGGNPDEMTGILKRWLDLFAGIGITAAVLHPGGAKRLSEGCSSEAVMETRVKVLRALTEHIEGTGMTICLENCGSAAQLFPIIEAAACRNLGICLDTGHLNMDRQNKEDNQAEFIKKAGSLLKALHIADNEGATDQHLMPYGKGTVCWEKVVPALKEIRYAGLLNLEIPGENRCPLPVRLAKLDYLKVVLDYMLSITKT